MSFKTTGLTGIRGIACLNVILYHLNQSRSITNLSPLDWSIYQFTESLAISVSFFFIIGGLYRSIPYWRSILLDEPIPETRRTIIDRFWRISPPYYAALIASFILALILGISGPDALVRLFSGLTFLSWIHPTTLFPVDISGPLWYISYDAMGTLTVMGIMLVLTKIPKRLIPVGIFGSALVLLGLHFLFIHLPFPQGSGVASVWFPFYNPFVFWLHFLIGIVVGYFFVARERDGQKETWWYDLIALLSFCAMVLFLWNIRGTPNFSYSWPHGPYRFPIVPALLGLLIFSLPSSVSIGKWLDNRFLSFIAKISYGVYLWQAIVIVLLHRFLFAAYPGNIPFKEWLELVALALPITWLIAWISYTLFEKWVMEWRKKKTLLKTHS